MAPTIAVGDIRSSEPLDGDVRGVVTGVAAATAQCFKSKHQENVVVGVVLPRRGGLPISVEATHTLRGATTTFPSNGEIACVKAAVQAQNFPLFSPKAYSLAFMESAPSGPVAEGVYEVEQMERGLADVVRKILGSRPDDAVVDFDRFKNVTTVRVDVTIRPLPPRIFSMSATLFGAFPGRVPPAEARGALSLSMRAEDWVYLKCHDVAMLIDGQPADLGAEHYDGDVIAGGVIESIMVPLPRPTLERMSQAARVEMKLCNDEMVFDPLSKPRLHSFLTEISPSP